MSDIIIEKKKEKRIKKRNSKNVNPLIGDTVNKIDSSGSDFIWVLLDLFPVAFREKLFKFYNKRTRMLSMKVFTKSFEIIQWY